MRVHVRAHAHARACVCVCEVWWINWFIMWLIIQLIIWPIGQSVDKAFYILENQLKDWFGYHWGFLHDTSTFGIREGKKNVWCCRTSCNWSSCIQTLQGMSTSFPLMAHSSEVSHISSEKHWLFHSDGFGVTGLCKLGGQTSECFPFPLADGWWQAWILALWALI